MQQGGVEFDAVTQHAVLLYEANQLFASTILNGDESVQDKINFAIAQYLRDRAKEIMLENE